MNKNLYSIAIAVFGIFFNMQSTEKNVTMYMIDGKCFDNDSKSLSFMARETLEKKLNTPFYKTLFCGKLEFKQAFKEVDAIALPTAPTPAFKLGEKTADPLTMYLEDIFTVPANIAGIPAISVPSGKTKDGLPIGLQLMAPHFGEATLFALAKKFASE